MHLVPSRPLILAISIAVALSACGGSSNDDQVVAVPAAPADQGSADVAPVPTVAAFVDTAFSNQRGDARYATLDTNAGVRVVAGFLEFWQPSTSLVDAGQSAPPQAGFPAVTASTWVAVDRAEYVAVTLPDGSGTGPIQDLSDALTSTLDEVEPSPAPAG